MKIDQRKLNPERLFNFLKGLAIAWLLVFFLLEGFILFQMWTNGWSWFVECPRPRVGTYQLRYDSPREEPIEESLERIKAESREKETRKSCLESKEKAIKLPIIGILPIVLLYTIRYGGSWTLNYVFPKEKSPDTNKKESV